MNIRFLIAITGILSITMSCAQNRNGENEHVRLTQLAKISDNEKRGIDEVVRFYGGQCLYGIGSTNSSKSGVVKYFKLEMSESKLIDDFIDKPEIPAFHIAYMFFKNLEEEVTNYDEIHTIIKFSDGEKFEFAYSMEELELVLHRIPIIEDLVDLLKSRNYQAIASLIDNEVFEIDLEQFISNIEILDPQADSIKCFIPVGSYTYEYEGGQSILHISGVLWREQQSLAFGVDFNLNETQNKLLCFDFNY